jgi:tRNA A37 threonylcarbamoyladenosine dehydratase
MSDISWLSRSALLLGDEGIEKLQTKHVLVVGLGGVGSFAAEFICRSGIGEITIVDGDVVDPSNRNRQLPALATNHGISKAEIMKERLLAINPALKIHVINSFLTPEMCRELFAIPYHYVMDCIDSIMPKITLLSSALENNVPIVSSMGAGGKMDPTKLRITFLPDTYQCVFASYIRKRLRKLPNLGKVKAVFSTEQMDKNSLIMTDGSNFKRSAYGTVSYLPAAFGGACASVVIRDLLGYPIELAERPLRISHKTLEKRKKKK